MSAHAVEAITTKTSQEAGLFHWETPWITLPGEVQVPGRDASGSVERQRLESDLAACRRSAEQLVEKHQRREPSSVVTVPAVRDAWRKFFLSHHAFFFDFVLLAECYRRATRALAEGRWPDREIDDAATLWRMAGALMLYGIDFTPTEEIYKTYIRTAMPEAFSGTWLREYQALSDARKRWARTLDEAKARDAERAMELKERLSVAERSYNHHHFHVMLACVPELTSKLQEYQMEHGSLSNSEHHLDVYDDWFHVVRSEELDLCAFARSAATVVCEVLADIRRGTGLAPEVLRLVAAGAVTMIDLLRADCRRRWPAEVVA